MNKPIFILGASDPEMMEIERVVRAAGYPVRYAATRLAGGALERTRSRDANNARDVLGGPIYPRTEKFVFVECRVQGLCPDLIVDHHQPGDPGYAAGAAEYMAGSSLGQVLSFLGQEPTELQRIIAAADHCPAQAYQGLCPGVSPEKLRQWRTASRAERRGVSFEQMEMAIESAHHALLTADKVTFMGQPFAWVSDRNCGEWMEASARYGIPFMYAERVARSNTTKLGIMSAAPDLVQAWMADCGLSEVYGNPHRGYAGGYHLKPSHQS